MNLQGVDLYRARLAGAQLTDAYLQNANLTEANLDYALYCKTTMPDGTVKNDNC
jgi:uncharacterized protein YjbI with pentapeptide repeats